MKWAITLYLKKRGKKSNLIILNNEIFYYWIFDFSFLKRMTRRLMGVGNSFFLLCVWSFFFFSFVVEIFELPPLVLIVFFFFLLKKKKKQISCDTEQLFGTGFHRRLIIIIQDASVCLKREMR